MLTEQARDRLVLLMAQKTFEESPAAQEAEYQDLAAEYEKFRDRLCGKLDDRRVELLRMLLDLRGQMEFEHNLYYLRQGLIWGSAMADKIEISRDGGYILS